MTPPDHIRIETWPDRTLVWKHGRSVRYLVIRIAADEIGAPNPQRPLGHNLGIVLDASSSMTGLPLQRSGEIAETIIERLSGRDRLSVVSFADDVQTHLKSERMDEAGRRKAKSEIGSITERPGSNLIDGWLQGAELVASDMEERPGRVNRLFLLSDGGAPDAPQSMEQVERYARGLERRGLPTTAIGVGYDVSLAPLIAIDDRRGQSLIVSEKAQEIANAAVTEYLDVAPVVAANSNIEIEAPARVKVQFLSELGETPGESARSNPIGDLRAGARRHVVAKLVFPRGAPGRQVNVTARLRWEKVETGEADIVRSTPAKFLFAAGRENSRQPRDPAATSIVAAIWQAAILSEVLRLNYEGRYQDARQLIDRETFYFVRYAAGMPEAEAQLRRLKQAINIVHKPWREREREHRDRSRLFDVDRDA